MIATAAKYTANSFDEKKCKTFLASEKTTITQWSKTLNTVSHQKNNIYKKKYFAQDVSK